MCGGSAIGCFSWRKFRHGADPNISRSTSLLCIDRRRPTFTGRLSHHVATLYCILYFTRFLTVLDAHVSDIYPIRRKQLDSWQVTAANCVNQVQGVRIQFKTPNCLTLSRIRLIAPKSRPFVSVFRLKTTTSGQRPDVDQFGM